METKNNILGTASHFVLWRGLFLVLFGLSAIYWAGPTLSALILVFGLFALADGFVLIFMYTKFHLIWGNATLWFGILSIFVGVCTLYFPGLTAILFAIFIALRAFVGGILELRMATHLRKHVTGEVLLILNGIISIIFSIALISILIIHPVFGLLVLIEAIGIYALCLGIIFIMLASRIKNLSTKEPVNTTEVF